MLFWGLWGLGRLGDDVWWRSSVITNAERPEYAENKARGPARRLLLAL